MVSRSLTITLQRVDAFHLGAPRLRYPPLTTVCARCKQQIEGMTQLSKPGAHRFVRKGSGIVCSAGRRSLSLNQCCGAWSDWVFDWEHVKVNAYNQPAVEFGKQAASDVLTLLRVLRDNDTAAVYWMHWCMCACMTS